MNTKTIVNGVYVAAELLERLERFSPKSHSQGMWWQNYRFSGLNKPLPVVFKAPPGYQLTPDTVYNIFICFHKGSRGKTERERPTVDHFVVRLYPQDGSSEAKIILRYAECGKDEDVHFRGKKPWKVVKFEGQERKGFLFFASLGGNTEVVVKKENLEVLFSGSCVVQITGSEELMPNGSTKIVIGSDSDEVMVIYDHRKNRWARFALVEHIRKTVGKRSFEFWNLRSFTGDPNTVGHILTNEGFREIVE